MLENPRYMDVLNKLKALPNPSDAKAAPEADSDEDKDLIGTMMGINATKKPQGSIGYIKFNPKDPQYDSDEDANQASAGTGKATSVDDIDELVNVPSQKSAEKRKVTKKQALELFTKLLQKETGTEIGGPSRGSQLKESMKNLAEAEEEEQEAPQERIPSQVWKAYYEDKTRQPGDRPRPTLQAGPASVRGPSGIMCNLREHPVQAGCTSVVTLRVGNLLYCANAGDSRAVLCRKDGVAYALSEDHKPTSSIEIARIEKAGGFVNVNGRINGNLNLSRSIGDMKYKQVGTLMPSEQMITAEPDVTVTEILATDKFFVLACDGVWDVLSNQEICDFISERLFPTNKPLKFDVKNSNFKGVLQAPMGLTDIVRDIFNYCVADDPKKTQGIGGDNMTCMIVQLNI
jgi:serine/threonine protein phosphatase PrpC